MKLTKYSTQTIYHIGKDDEYTIKIDKVERSRLLYLTVERYNENLDKYENVAYKDFGKNETAQAKAYALDIIKAIQRKEVTK